MRHIIKQLEYHVADACNMSCEFCTHYSNFKGPANIISATKAEEEWAPWSEKIIPTRFHIIGGEPLLNPEICDIVLVAKRVWCLSTIVLYSNGLLIDKHPKLSEALKGGRFVLGLHYGDKRDEDIKGNVERFFSGCDVRVDIVDGMQGWLQFYKLDDKGAPLQYTDNNQRSSWENCIAAQQKCFVLKDNRLWKCAQIAFAKRAGISWFEGYNSCQLDGDIEGWVAIEDELCCGNCPATKQLAAHGAEFMNLRIPT